MAEDENEQSTTEQAIAEEEETDGITTAALVERIEALAARLNAIEEQNAIFTEQLTGYDGRLSEFDTRFTPAPEPGPGPGERHWYFRKVKNEIE
jgi:hypothetical protein